MNYQSKENGKNQKIERMEQQVSQEFLWQDYKCFC